ncbi:MAG: hypothetical protein HDS33_06745 [Bacteroides sp.]|nr:hypothetical protein [Bacteroides sp.]
MNQDTTKKLVSGIITALATLATAAAAGVAQGRKHGQEKLQKHVNETAPRPVKKDKSIKAEQIKKWVSFEENVDITNFQEVPMDSVEKDEWKTVIPTLGAEVLKVELTELSFNGLLKCDIPTNELCRLGDKFRGFSTKNGKITQHGKFTEAGVAEMAPLLIFQCMAAVTSQYYQHIITERLNYITNKIEDILEFIEDADQAKLNVAFHNLVELNEKCTYDQADKVEVTNISTQIGVILDTYSKKISEIHPKLKVDYKWFDKKEASAKVNKLKDSKYFDYFQRAMSAEVLYFISSVISIKIAKFLGNEEDVERYTKRLNLDLWDKYIDQFNLIKHDVIAYLEGEAAASWLNKKEIKAMRDQQLKQFNDLEKSMLELQERLNCRTVQYIQIQEDGDIKKYIEVSKNAPE